MAGRRRKWLIASALLVIVATMAWLATRSGPRIALELSFAGYTNTPMAYSIRANFGPTTITTIVQTAHVLVKNGCAVPIRLDTRRGEKGYVTFDGVWVFRGAAGMPVGSNPPNVIKPGESTTIVIGPENFAYRWSTEVWAQPYLLRDRVAAKLGTLPGGMMQKLSSKLASPRNGVLFKLDPVTNRPPTKPPTIFH